MAAKGSSKAVSQRSGLGVDVMTLSVAPEDMVDVVHRFIELPVSFLSLLFSV